MRKCLLLSLFCLMTISCMDGTRRLADTQLSVILDGDMNAIKTGLADSLLSSKPTYKIVTKTWYEKSRFSCNVVAEFYFLRDSSFCIERKYRFDRNKKMWERYYNAYKLIQK